MVGARNKIKKGKKRGREKREISMRTKVANYFPAITGVHSRSLFLAIGLAMPLPYAAHGVRMIPSTDRDAGTR